MSDFWVGEKISPKSPYYPFPKVIDACTLDGVEKLPYVLTKYLMDMELPDYTPPSDNSFPRARFKRLIYWDSPDALEKPLPTDEQMRSIFFDSRNPGTPPDADRGYRIFPQELTAQSQISGQSILRINLGDAARAPSRGGFVLRQTVIYTIMCNYDLESNLDGIYKSRAMAIAQAIIAATAGVNFGGVGGMVPYTVTKFDDERNNTGYKIYQHIDWAGGNSINEFYC